MKCTAQATDDREPRKKGFHFKEFPLYASQVGGVFIVHRSCGNGRTIKDMDEAVVFMLEHECPKEEK